MSRLIQTFFASSVLFALSVSASPVGADGYRHIKEMALEVQLKTDALMAESQHYVHTDYYHEMIRKIARMRQRAVQVYVLSIQRGCLVTISEELRRLDNQVHRVEALFDNVEREASHGYGHIHGATAHVKSLLNRIQECVHHIRDDISELTGPVYRSPYSGYREVGYGHRSHFGHPSYSRIRVPYTSQQYGHGHGGVSYRNKNFSIRFGF